MVSANLHAQREIYHEGIFGYAVVLMLMMYIFASVIRLWVFFWDFGLQGPHREKEKLEKERNELRDLVMPMLPEKINQVVNV